MNYCPECGTSVAENDRFCVNCGASLTSQDRNGATQRNECDPPSPGADAPQPTTGFSNGPQPAASPKKGMGCFTTGCIGLLTWFVVQIIRGSNAVSVFQTGNAPLRPNINRIDENTANENRISVDTTTNLMDTRVDSGKGDVVDTIDHELEKTDQRPLTKRIQDDAEISESEFLNIVKVFNTHSGNDFQDRQLREPYKNKPVVVSGKIVEVKEGFIAAAKIKLIVHGKTVMAAFPSMPESTVSRFKVGDHIKISGNPDLSLFYSLDLNQCRYLGKVDSPPRESVKHNSEFEDGFRQAVVDQLVSELLGGN